MTVRIALFASDVAGARPLLDAFAESATPAEVLIAGELRLDLGERRSDLRLVVNLVDDRSPAVDRAMAAEYLAYLADIEVPVVNGLDAFVVGASPARQTALLDHLLVDHPRALVIADAGQIPAAVRQLELDPAEAVVRGDAPILVSAPGPPGEVVRLAFNGGRFLAAHVGSEAVGVDDSLVRLASQVVHTASIEFGGVSFGVDPQRRTPVCVDVDTHLGDAPGETAALAEYARYRAGLGGGGSLPVVS